MFFKSPFRFFQERSIIAASMRKATININRASRRELEALPLIGPKRAAIIVAFRESHGWFGSVDDLDLVPGIGKTIIKRLEGLIVV